MIDGEKLKIVDIPVGKTIHERIKLLNNSMSGILPLGTELKTVSRQNSPSDFSNKIILDESSINKDSIDKFLTISDENLNEGLKKSRLITLANNIKVFLNIEADDNQIGIVEKHLKKKYGDKYIIFCFGKSYDEKISRIQKYTPGNFISNAIDIGRCSKTLIEIYSEFLIVIELSKGTETDSLYILTVLLGFLKHQSSVEQAAKYIESLRWFQAFTMSFPVLKRYAKYFDKLIEGDIDYKPHIVFLRQIIITTIPKHPEIEVENPEIVICQDEKVLLRQDATYVDTNFIIFNITEKPIVGQTVLFLNYRSGERVKTVVKLSVDFYFYTQGMYRFIGSDIETSYIFDNTDGYISNEFSLDLILSEETVRTDLPYNVKRNVVMDLQTCTRHAVLNKDRKKLVEKYVADGYAEFAAEFCGSMDLTENETNAFMGLLTSVGYKNLIYHSNPVYVPNILKSPREKNINHEVLKDVQKSINNGLDGKKSQLGNISKNSVGFKSTSKVENFYDGINNLPPKKKIEIQIDGKDTNLTDELLLLDDNSIKKQTVDGIDSRFSVEKNSPETNVSSGKLIDDISSNPSHNIKDGAIIVDKASRNETIKTILKDIKDGSKKILGEKVSLKKTSKIKMKVKKCSEKRSRGTDTELTHVARKPLHWIPIISTSRTIFSEMKSIKIDINIPLFEKLFCDTIGEKPMETEKIKREVTVLDGRRIFLGSLALKHLELRNIKTENIDKIINEKPEILSLEDLYNIKKLFLTENEKKMLETEIKKEKPEICNTEREMLSVSNMGDLCNIVEIFLFERKLCEEIVLIRQTLDNILLAFNRITNSKNLKYLLKAGLDIGNKINHQYSARGKKASGYHLESIYTFVTYTGKQNKTLFGFLVYTLKKNKIPVEEIFGELDIINKVNNENIGKLKDKINEYVIEYNGIGKLYRMIGEKSRKRCEKALIYSKWSLKEVSEKYKECISAEAQIKKHLGEAHTKSVNEIFVSILYGLSKLKEELNKKS